MYHNQFTINSFVYNKEKAVSIGLYDEHLEALEDWEFNLRFSLNYRIGKIDQYLCNYHRRDYGTVRDEHLNVALSRHLKEEKNVRGLIKKKVDLTFVQKRVLSIFSVLVKIKIKIKGLRS